MKKLAHLLVGAFVLLSYGWFNRFPFVYPDTGDHISSGFLNYVPQSRPIFYGLFLRHVSLSESLWFPVIFQGLFIAWCFYLLANYLFSKKWTLPFWVMIVICTAFTGVSVLASTLLPDVFTPVLIVTCLSLLSFNLSKTDKWISALLLFISIPMHNSHLPVVLAMIGFALLRMFTLRAKENMNLKRLFLPFGTVVICVLAVFTTNYAVSGKWKMSNGGSVFMVNRLIEVGILQEYLEENCQDQNTSLCAYQDQLKWGFLWENDSPLYKLGGWDVVEEDFSKLWKSALSKPKHLKQFIIKSVEGTLAQWWMVDIDWVIKQKEGTSPHMAITRFYPDYKITYESSGQNIGVWDFQNLNDWQKILMLLLSVLFFMMLLNPKGLNVKKHSAILWLFFIGLLSNSFICAAVSNPLSRYQYRVSFLLVAFVLLLFWNGSSFSFPKLKAEESDNDD